MSPRATAQPRFFMPRLSSRAERRICSMARGARSFVASRLGMTPFAVILGITASRSLRELGVLDYHGVRVAGAQITVEPHDAAHQDKVADGGGPLRDDRDVV